MKPFVAWRVLSHWLSQAAGSNHSLIWVPNLAGLLRGMAQQGVEPAFIARILAAFPESPSNRPPAFAAKLPAPLTDREFQVLELLSQRYRDKEIGGAIVHFHAHR